MGVVWHGVKEFETALTHINVNVVAAAKEAGVAAGRELQTVAQATVVHKSGDLAASIEVHPKTVGAIPLVQVGPTIVYGRRVDIGFKGRKSARGVRKRRAAGIDTGRRGLQPTKGSHFLEKSLEAAGPRIAETYKKAWARAITRF